MISTFGYLIGTEARNRLRRQAKRLKSPRYALALVVGLAYFFFAFGGTRMLGATEGPTFGSIATGAMALIGPLLLAVYAAMTWILGRGDALAYRPAEVALLFTGPLTRRDLLRFKLLQAQVPLAFSATFMTLISHGSPLPWWLRLPSLWVLLSTLQLHHMAAALVHGSAQQQGLVGWRRNWLPITVFGVAALLLLAALSDAINAARVAPDLRAGMHIIGDALQQPIPATILLPFRLVSAPLGAGSGEWPGAIGLALLVLLAHYVWVLRSGTAFEEAAAEAGERKAKAMQALRSGGGWRSAARALEAGRKGKKKSKVATPPFTLALHGEPAVAVFWKNVTFARRSTSLASPVGIGVAAAVIMATASSSGEAVGGLLRHAGIMAFAFGAMMVLLGPIMIRNDLRMDLRAIELLRTYPLPAARLVGAEIAASATTASIIQFALLGLSAVLLALADSLPFPPGQFLLLCIGTVLVVPALATLGATIQCAIAMTFPAWVHLGAERPQGVEAMGQNILTMVGSMLLLALLLVLPVGIGLVGTLVLSANWGPLAPAIGGALGIAAIYGEVVLAARLLGRMFDRMDPVEVGLAR